MWGVLGLQKTDEMSGQRPQDLQPVPDPPGTSRKVGDENTSSRSRQSPGEGGIRSLGFSPSPDRIDNSRGRAIKDCMGRLGGHVSRAEAGASSGDDQIHPAPVGPLQEGGDNQLRLVRDHVSENHLMALFPAPLLQQLPAGIDPFPPTARIGDRENTDAQRGCPDGVQRRTDPLV